MRLCLRFLLVTLLACSFTLPAQAPVSAEELPELSLILEPGPLHDGLPQVFTFHLLNVGQKMLRIPNPTLDCGGASVSGSLILSQAWQPPAGTGLGTGNGSCDGGGMVPSTPPPSITKTAQTWQLLKPGESLYISTHVHHYFTSPGTHTFSGTYLAPHFGETQAKALSDAGIMVPKLNTTSGSLTYKTDFNKAEQH